MARPCPVCRCRALGCTVRAAALEVPTHISHKRGTVPSHQVSGKTHTFCVSKPPTQFQPAPETPFVSSPKGFCCVAEPRLGMGEMTPRCEVACRIRQGCFKTKNTTYLSNTYILIISQSSCLFDQMLSIYGNIWQWD